MKNRNYIMCLLAIAVVWIWTWSGPIYAQERLPIRHDGRTIGTITKLDISPDISNPSRALISISAHFPNFPRELDHALRARGNMGSGTHRIYWRGNTSIQGDGTRLRMASRIRYEWWPDLIFDRVRAIRDTKTVDWEVFLYPSRLSELRIAYRLTNIRGIGNDIERMLGLRRTRTTNITLPGQCGRCRCEELLDATNPALEIARFSNERTDVEFMVTLAINADLAEAVRCIPR